MAADDMVSRPSILVAEDDPDLRRMLKMMLSTRGRVTAVEDGMEALLVLKDDPLPDLLITDLMMPRMDGLTLSRRMKEDARLARIPVIMLTAKDTPRDVIKGINAGARHYLTKPFKQEALLDKVQHVLAKKPH